NNTEGLQTTAKKVSNLGIKYMLTELIPGPDSLLSSYYTHIDKDGNSLFHFTKCVLRRYPENFGGGCYHGTKWFPETAKVGEHFFRSMNFTGLGNVEFKEDPRDGKLKIIECNARFTAAQELLNYADIDISYQIYCFLAGLEVPKIDKYKTNKWLWYPREDYSTFKDLRRNGKLTLWEWLKSINWLNLTFPKLKISDPLPAIIGFKNYTKKKYFK
ncbi:carboxylate--amine ligase, partial [Calditrichota bacterium]